MQTYRHQESNIRKEKVKMNILQVREEMKLPRAPFTQQASSHPTNYS